MALFNQPTDAMRSLFLFLLFTCSFPQLFAQTPPRQLPAKRTTTTVKIDASLDEPVWKEAVPATKFVEWRPNFGAIEDTDTRTEVYLLYDNTSIYVGGYCHERSKDSVSKELVGRDVIGVRRGDASTMEVSCGWRIAHDDGS